MKIAYTPTFVRQFKKLPKDLQIEIKEKIELFRKNPKHSFLKIHKLKGALKSRWSFFVNYSYRILFQYLDKTEIILLAVGDHDIYKN